MAGPRFLYLHGFASGPGSKKGVMLAAHYAERGVNLERLNLRLPSFEHLRVSAMLAAVRSTMDESAAPQAERVVLFGSSLGGFVAAQVAARDPRVAALVLLAPAFHLVERWQQRLGAEGWQKWQESGWLETHDHTTGQLGRVDFDFVRDLSELDGQGLPDVRVPTLILHGRQDEVVDIATSRRFVEGKRHMRLVELEDGHELASSLPRIQEEADAFLLPFIGEPESARLAKSEPSEKKESAAGVTADGERVSYSIAVYPRRGDKVLLIRHRRLGVWLPPGGECQPGERPQEAAARELREETGLVGTFPITSDIEGTPPGLIGYEEHRAGSKGIHLNFVFVVDVSSDEIKPNHEFGEWRWVSLAEGPWPLPSHAAPRNVEQLARVALAAPRSLVTPAR